MPTDYPWCVSVIIGEPHVFEAGDRPEWEPLEDGGYYVPSICDKERGHRIHIEAEAPESQAMDLEADVSPGYMLATIAEELHRADMWVSEAGRLRVLVTSSAEDIEKLRACLVREGQRVIVTPHER